MNPLHGHALPRLVRADEKGIVPVVDGDIHDTWNLRFQSFPQDGIQSGRMVDAKAPNSERLRQIGQVRVAEFRADRPLEFRHLLPPDAPQPSISEDDIDGRSLLSLRGLELVNAHEEPAVAAQGDDPTVWIHQLGGDSAREGDAHRGEAVRDDDRLGLHDAKEAAEPQLVCAHIRYEEVVRFQDLAQVPQYPLRVQQSIAVLAELRFQPLLDRRGGWNQPHRGARCVHSLPQGLQRFADFADHLDLREVAGGNLRRKRIDVDNPPVPPRIPRTRVVLDEVISDANHEVRVIESRELVIPRENSDGQEAHWRGPGDRALSHDRGHHGDLQAFGELRQLRGRTVADHAVPREDDGSGRFLDEDCGLFDARSGRSGSADRFSGQWLLLRVGLVLRDVLREFDMGGPGLFRLGEFERLPHDLRDDVWALDAGIPFRDGTEQMQDVDVLMGLPMDLREIRLGGDRDERRPIE